MESDFRAREKRLDFLLEMYKQCSSHLNRHVTAMWQCVVVIAAASATLRIEQMSAMFDLGISIAIILCAWLMASTYDACNWFNRNIAIISNIERLFLEPDDMKKVHPYFESSIAPGKIIGHFKIQLYLAICVGTTLLAGHFYLRVLPGFSVKGCVFEPMRALPYAIVIASLSFVKNLRAHHVNNEEEFASKSPGVAIARAPHLLY